MTANVLCKTGKHKYETVNDGNPENVQAAHLECVHCGKIKEKGSASDAKWSAWFGGSS